MRERRKKKRLTNAGINTPFLIQTSQRAKTGKKPFQRDNCQISPLRMTPLGAVSAGLAAGKKRFCFRVNRGRGWLHDTFSIHLIPTHKGPGVNYRLDSSFISVHTDNWNLETALRKKEFDEGEK